MATKKQRRSSRSFSVGRSRSIRVGYMQYIVNRSKALPHYKCDNCPHTARLSTKP